MDTTDSTALTEHDLDIDKRLMLEKMKVVQQLRFVEGLTIEDACDKATENGVTIAPSTFHKWMADGEIHQLLSRWAHDQLDQFSAHLLEALPDVTRKMIDIGKGVGPNGTAVYARDIIAVYDRMIAQAEKLKEQSPEPSREEFDFLEREAPGWAVDLQDGEEISITKTQTIKKSGGRPKKDVTPIEGQVVHGDTDGE